MKSLALSLIALLGLTLAANAQCASGYTQLSNVYACQQNTTGAPVITSPGSASGTVGVGFNYQITATNSPTSFSATGLPFPLAVNTSSGLISGTPSAPFSGTVVLGATNGSGTGNQNLALTIASGSSMWNPVDISDGSLDLWWDANNSGSLTMSGTTVTAWRDLAHNVTASPIGSNSVYTTGSLNGLPGIAIGGGLTAATTSFGKFSAATTVLVVVKPTALTWNNVYGALLASTVGEPLLFLGNANPSPLAIGSAEVNGFVSTQTLALNTAGITEWVTPGVSGGNWGPSQPYLNGNTGGSIAAVSMGAYTQTGVEIGTSANSAGPPGLSGLIYEIVNLNASATTADRHTTEGYLAWKWGLQGSLPTGHPCKSAAPTWNGSSSSC